MRAHASILCKEQADFRGNGAAAIFRCYNGHLRRWEDCAMRLTIEIIAALLLVLFVGASSAAFAVG